MRATALVGMAIAILALLLWRTLGAPTEPPQAQEPRVDKSTNLDRPPAEEREPLAVLSAPEHVGPNQVLVRTIDSIRRPVAGVSVYSLLINEHEPLGRTDEAGELSVEVAKEHQQVLVKKDGFATRSAWLPRPEEGGHTIEIVLALDRALHGRVTLANHQPVGEGVTVIAIPSASHGWSNIGHGHLGAGGDPRCLVTVTDGDGAFEVSGCEPNRAYDLFAGGRGYATSSSRNRAARAIPSRAGAIELVVHKLTIARFRIVTSGTEGAVPLRRLGHPSTGVYSFFLEDEPIQPTPLVGPGLELAGVETSRRRTTLDKERTFLFEHDKRFDNVDLRCELRLPLHEVAETRFRPKPVDEDTPVFELTVQSHTDGYGSIEVLFDSPIYIGQHHRLSDAIQLELTPEADPLSRMLFALDMDYPAQAGLVSGIPKGGYLGHVIFRDGGFSYPDGDGFPVYVGDNPGVLSVPNPNMGSIELVPETATGRFGGPIQVNLGYGDPRTEANGAESWAIGAGPLCFFEPPYHLGGLQEGQYRVSFIKPQSESRLVEVVAGEHRRISFEVRERY